MPRKSIAKQKEKALEIKIPKADLMEVLDEYNAAIDEAIGSRQRAVDGWREAYLWRMGEKGKPDPNLPFKDSSDIRFRLSEQIIRKLKPIYLNSIWATPRMVRAIPLKPGRHESADRLENFYNYVYRGVIPSFRKKVAGSINSLLETGKAVAKITWKAETQTIVEQYPKEALKLLAMQSVMLAGLQQIAETGEKPEVPKEPSDDQISKALFMALKWDDKDEVYQKRVKEAVSQYRSGKEIINLVREEPGTGRAEITVIEELESIIVPSNTTTISEADWVAHDLLMSEQDLRMRSTESGGSYRGVSELLESAKVAYRNEDRNRLARSMENVEGITVTGELKGYITVRELYCWIPRKYIAHWRDEPGEDDTRVRAVITYCPEREESQPLRIMELPYEHGQWPFEDVNWNYGRNRYYAAEGVPAIINSYEKEYNISRNAAIDRTTIMLSPPTFIWAAAKISPTAHRQIGQTQVTRVQPNLAVHTPQSPDLASGFNFDAAQMQVWAEEIAGLPNLRALGNYNEPPTAEQVQQMSAPAQGIQTFELEMWHDFWGRVFGQVHSLYRQFMFAGEYEAKPVGFTNMENPQEALEITQEDFEGEYLIQPGGDLSLGSPVLQAQKLFLAFQTAFAYPQLAPLIKPFDLARIFFSRTVGYQDAQAFLRSSQETQQAEQQFLQMQAQMAAAQQQGKGGRSRNPRLKQIPNAANGLVPA